MAEILRSDHLMASNDFGTVNGLLALRLRLRLRLRTYCFFPRGQLNLPGSDAKEDA
jgi:hypothetical protein